MSEYVGFSEDEPEVAVVSQTEAMKAKALEIDAILAPLAQPQMKGVIEYFKKIYIERQIVRGNDTQFEAGIRQGEANFVLDLINTVERLHNGN